MITRATEGDYHLKWCVNERKLHVYDYHAGFWHETFARRSPDANADFRWCVNEFRKWAAKQAWAVQVDKR